MAGGDRIPQVSDLHFPLGGHRFRPCLEDVLEMLLDELGVDCPRDVRRVLAEGRERWRLKQVAASATDSPETAARVLRELGYQATRVDGAALPDLPDGLRRD